MLTVAQRWRFVRSGYLVLPRLVPSVLRERALQAIDDRLTAEPQRVRDDLHSLDDLMRSPEICSLFNDSLAFEVAEALLGRDRVRPAHGGHIALRFPDCGGELIPGIDWHVDGTGFPRNGIAVGSYRRRFTLLAVVYLRDVTQRDRGNFTIQPGAHRAVARRLRREGLTPLERTEPPVAVTRPMQFVGHAGDVCLTHFLMPHTAAHNRGDEIRYAVIFRIRHVRIDGFDNAACFSIWSEYGGLFSPARLGAAERGR